MNIVELKNVKKIYGNSTVVNIENLRIKEGEIYGLIGPNGAGKSTIMKMICSISKVSEGEIYILNQKLQSKSRIEILKNMGSLIEGPSYYENLTGRENMQIVRDLKNLNDEKIDEAITIVGLKNQMSKKVKNYSLGMKQRLGIAMAIAGLPKLLILDEPTNGLDPQGMDEIRELIKSLPLKYGISVMISSHILDEVEKMVDNIGIINKGELLYNGSVESFKVQHGAQLALRTSNNKEALFILSEYNGIIEENILKIPIVEDVEVGEVVNRLVREKIEVYRVYESVKSLEKLFIELTGKGSL